MNALGKGIMIASAVASLITSGSLVARATDKAGDEMVHCAGINECKGKASCATAETFSGPNFEFGLSLCSRSTRFGSNNFTTTSMPL